MLGSPGGLCFLHEAGSEIPSGNGAMSADLGHLRIRRLPYGTEHRANLALVRIHWKEEGREEYGEDRGRFRSKESPVARGVPSMSGGG